MSDISKHLLKTFLPYLIAFLLGVIVAWKGCGDTSGKPVTTIIEKPVPVIEYVDRWKEKPVRYVEGKRSLLDTLKRKLLPYMIPYK